MLRKATLIGVLFSLATFARLLHGGEFVNIIAAAAAATADNKPTPAPVPAPSAECDNCGGTGKLGDGTVSVTCPVCDGTGKSNGGTEAPALSGIHWVTPEEAAASPLPDYWCVTQEDGSCPPCLRLKGLLADPRVVAWSRHYDCVKSDRLDGKLPKGYPIQRWGKRVREGVLPGYGVNELMWDFAGKKPAAVRQQVAAVRQGYRSRSGGHWSYPGNIHAHLISEHGAGIDAVWVRSLSTNEARTLHDDLHTGNADWTRIVRR